MPWRFNANDHVFAVALIAVAVDATPRRHDFGVELGIEPPRQMNVGIRKDDMTTDALQRRTSSASASWSATLNCSFV